MLLYSHRWGAEDGLAESWTRQILFFLILIAVLEAHHPYADQHLLLNITFCMNHILWQEFGPINGKSYPLSVQYC